MKRESSLFACSQRRRIIWSELNFIKKEIRRDFLTNSFCIFRENDEEMGLAKEDERVSTR